ncbi:hypothetical protein [Asticcacaulis sp.]
MEKPDFASLRLYLAAIGLDLFRRGIARRGFDCLENVASTFDAHPIHKA